MKVIREPPGNPEALYPIGTIRNPDPRGEILAMPEASPSVPRMVPVFMLTGTSRNARPRSGAWMHGKERRRPHQSDVSGPARDLGFSPEGGDPARRRFTDAIKAYWASPCSMSWIHTP